MRIKKIEVRNFRALRDSSLELAGTTALLGENNAGKSAFLLALDLFFAGSPKVTQKDFSDDNTGAPIDITLTFHQLTPSDRQEFSANLLGEELIVTRRLVFGGAGDSGRYFVSARVNPGFVNIRAESGKTEKRKLYTELREQFGGELPKEKNADEIDGFLEAWEQEHPEALELMKVASFKGWTNVAVGKLKQRTNFVLVRAVQNAVEDLQASRSSPVRNLLESIARQTIENSADFQSFVRGANDKIRSLTDPANVPVLAEIGSGLTEVLARYYKDSQIIATWEPVSQIQPAFPVAQIDVRDNDFVTGLDGVGHGLQRAIILSVLQYMVAHAAKEGGGANFKEAQSDLILAIEEPEIYQHPTKQRMFGKLLRELSVGFSAETGIRVQVVLVTHSPLMISLPECEGIRMVRRISKGREINVQTTKMSLGEAAERSALVWGRKAEEAFADAQYAAKLHTFDSQVAEGFFARRVVLVEGVGDQSVLEAYYRLLGRDPYAEGTVISQVNGKGNLERPVVVFQRLGVPCYWVFDNDNAKAIKMGVKEPRAAEAICAANKMLQRLAEIPEDDLQEWPVGVYEKFTCWDNKLEKYVRSKAADDFEYLRLVEAVAAEFDVDAEVCLKYPASASRLLKLMHERGVKFEELRDLVAKVDALPLI